MDQNIKTNDDAQSGEKKGADPQKKPVDVSTLEKSTATSGNNPENAGPVAAGAASS